MSITAKKYPVAHCGVTSEGHIIIALETEVVLIHEQSCDVRRQRVSKFYKHLEEPWVFPPVPLHRIIGTLANGKKVSAEMAGYCWNDAQLLDEMCGEGTYESVMPSEEVQILNLARELYRKAAA